MGNIPSKTSRRPGPSAAAAGALLLHVHRLLLLITVSALLSVRRLLSVSLLLLLLRRGIVASSSLWRALWWLVRLLGILWPSVEIFVRHVRTENGYCNRNDSCGGFSAVDDGGWVDGCF